MERILLYHCRALLMDEADTLLEGAYVVVEGETISSVGTQRPQGPFDREIDCGNNVLMPGLVNAHTHIPMTLLRGYGGGATCTPGSTSGSSPRRPSWTAGRSGPAQGWPWPSLLPAG